MCELKQERIDALGFLQEDIELVVSDSITPADGCVDGALVPWINGHAHSLETFEGDLHIHRIPGFVDVAIDQQTMLAAEALLHQEPNACTSRKIASFQARWWRSARSALSSE